MGLETFLCVATRDWNSLWRDSQQIMSRLAPHYRVLYFNPGRDPQHSVLHELLHKSSNGFILRMEQVRANLIVVPNPPSIPHARRFLPRSVLRLTMPLVIRSNAWMVIRQVRRVTQTLNVKAPILWLYSPYQIDLIGKFGEKLVCYFNYDEFSNFVDNARIKDLVRRLDDELTERVDVVFATSRAQWEHRKAINQNTYFVPNGVDFQLFNRALDPDLPLAVDIAKLPRPVIGYAGWLGNQIDVELLNRMAEAYPTCSLALVGPDNLPKTKAEKELRTRQNVFFLGRKEPRELPAYLKAFDVALVPYVLFGYPLTAYPLKLHEYLAAGRSIVATAMPELRHFSQVVQIAESHDEFISRVRDAMSDHTPKAIEARVAVARENTWEQRVVEICHVLQGRLSTEEGGKR
jgi:glycosyltransferase involved in cell wall biosynthesis